MGSTSPPSLLLSYMLILMRIGQVIQQTVAPPSVIVSYLAPLLFLGAVRNNLLLLAPILRQNIVL